MEVKVLPSVTVITPTIGADSLEKVLESVRNQTYKNIRHLVVVDGRGCILPESLLKHDKNVDVVFLPYNTGGSGYYGHRIYAAFSHLVNSDYIAFLDEDNWYEPDHIQSLMNTIEENSGSYFAYSLRKVWLDESEGGTFLADDCCESIGLVPIYGSSDQHLVDTSCYLFSKDTLVYYGHHWHAGWGADRLFFKAMMQLGVPCNTTGKHTLNYRLPKMTVAYGGDFDFFKKGNEIVKQKHGGTYPWLAAKT